MFHLSQTLLAMKVDMHGFDGFGGPLYAGTGCFHRRDVLCGKKFTKESKFQWKKGNYDLRAHQSTEELEEEAKPLASCTYEQNTQWGNEVYVQQSPSVIFFF